MRQLRAKFVISFFALLLVSCASKSPSIQQHVSLSDKAVCRVAVLLFTNASGYRDGDVLFYRVFTAELARLQDFELVQEGDIRAAYRQIRVNPNTDRLSFDQLRIIGDYWDVQVAIQANILEMGEKYLQGKNFPFMTVRMDLIDAVTGRKLSTIHHQRSGEDYLKVMHFGLVSTTTELSHLISQEIINDLTTKGFTAQCSE